MHAVVIKIQMFWRKKVIEAIFYLPKENAARTETNENLLAPCQGYKEDEEELQNSVRKGTFAFDLTYADGRCRGGE